MRRRRTAVPAALIAAAVALFTMVGPALACGGLIGPNGAVNLLRTTTFVGYHAGVEHYVTSFEFVGGGGRFGSITPLPGVPSNVERGGDWTLQRLIRETQPVAERLAFDALAAPAGASGAQVLLQTRIDALDITVLKGGGDDVGAWAKANGFRLPPDAPEVLDFYAARSPIFLAASFDADAAAARGQSVGDGTPIHVTIPTPNPWVPLHILGLGKSDAERIEADVYLLTDLVPTFLPAPTERGMSLAHGAPASEGLLTDLRTDKGMGWVPASGWLTQIRLDAAATELTYDLAVDATGQGTPSRVAAGLAQPPAIDRPLVPAGPLILLFGTYVIAIALAVLRIGNRPVPSS
jgi:uncharacterized protein DUF2330